MPFSLYLANMKCVVYDSGIFYQKNYAATTMEDDKNSFIIPEISYRNETSLIKKLRNYKKIIPVGG
jgi:hypothetical protein